MNYYDLQKIISLFKVILYLIIKREKTYTKKRQIKFLNELRILLLSLFTLINIENKAESLKYKLKIINGNNTLFYTFILNTLLEPVFG